MSVESTRSLLDSVLKGSPLPWWEWEIPSNRVAFNELKATMLGYTAERFAGAGYQAFTDLLHEEDREPTMQAMRDHLEGRAPIYRIDYRILAADGHYEWYMDRGGIIEQAADGAPVRLRGIVIDLGANLRIGAERDALLKVLRRALPRGADANLLVLCAGCRALKLSDGRSVEVSADLPQLVGAQVSHGLCSRCMRRLYPEHAAAILDELPPWAAGRPEH
jgi:PAS domain S-box-containing protein